MIEDSEDYAMLIIRELKKGAYNPVYERVETVTAMKKTLKIDHSLVFSYLTLRKAIGFLGIALPFAVSLGALLLFRTGIQSSISSYYYTGTRDVLVGSLWAIGFFLLSYKGYERIDSIAGKLGRARQP